MSDELTVEELVEQLKFEAVFPIGDYHVIAPHSYTFIGPATKNPLVVDHEARVVYLLGITDPDLLNAPRKARWKTAKLVFVGVWVGFWIGVAAQFVCKIWH